MTHNQKIIQRYKHEKWYLIIILIFILAGIGLYITRPKIISPCGEFGCKVNTVVLKENLTIQEWVIIAGVRKFGVKHIEALTNIVFHESSFDPNATNPSSGACGLFQAYPCQKMQCSMGDYECQINWGLNYIAKRYTDPSNAWEFWKQNGWY